MSHLNPVHLCVNSITENSIGNHLMNRTNTFCRQQIEQGIPRVECIKQAAQCLGRQPGSNVWVLNEDMQFDSEGVRISNVQSEYIWLGGRIGKRNLPNVAPPTDAAVVPALAEPLDALRHPAMPHRNFKYVLINSQELISRVAFRNFLFGGGGGGQQIYIQPTTAYLANISGGGGEIPEPLSSGMKQLHVHSRTCT